MVLTKEKGLMVSICGLWLLLIYKSTLALDCGSHSCTGSLSHWTVALAHVQDYSRTGLWLSLISWIGSLLCHMTHYSRIITVACLILWFELYNSLCYLFEALYNWLYVFVALLSVYSLDGIHVASPLFYILHIYVIVLDIHD